MSKSFSTKYALYGLLSGGIIGAVVGFIIVSVASELGLFGLGFSYYGFAYSGSAESDSIILAMTLRAIAVCSLACFVWNGLLSTRKLFSVCWSVLGTIIAGVISFLFIGWYQNGPGRGGLDFPVIIVTSTLFLILFLLFGIFGRSDSAREAVRIRSKYKDLRKKAKKGDMRAQYEYALKITMYDLHEKRKWLEKAAAQGHSAAINELEKIRKAKEIKSPPPTSTSNSASYSICPWYSEGTGMCFTTNTYHGNSTRANLYCKTSNCTNCPDYD